jgi:antitoxin (DNA-binding transcriptional repressor) of toxin-antitoxin stability system
MIVNIHAAKTNLSKLIESAESGEEVIIARNGKPIVRLELVVPAPHGVAEAAASSFTHAADPDVPSWFGALKGKIWIAPGSEDPDEELAREMEDGPIFPPDDP